MIRDDTQRRSDSLITGVPAVEAVDRCRVLRAGAVVVVTG